VRAESVAEDRSRVSAERWDLPTPDPDTQPFWDAAREGRFLIRRCRDCAAAHFYPRPFCPSCWSEAVEWEDASGQATLYTYSVVRHNDLPPWPERVPYIPAVVDLAEGPRANTRLAGCAPEDVRIGMPLVVDFVDHAEGLVLPVFRPVVGG
jgi:uncharacterized OB-fold protein